MHCSLDKEICIEFVYVKFMTILQNNDEIGGGNYRVHSAAELLLKLVIWEKCLGYRE